jgi:hypothetical protein
MLQCKISATVLSSNWSRRNCNIGWQKLCHNNHCDSHNEFADIRFTSDHFGVKFFKALSRSQNVDNSTWHLAHSQLLAASQSARVRIMCLTQCIMYTMAQPHGLGMGQTAQHFVTEWRSFPCWNNSSLFHRKQNCMSDGDFCHQWRETEI